MLLTYKLHHVRAYRMFPCILSINCIEKCLEYKLEALIRLLLSCAVARKPDSKKLGTVGLTCVWSIGSDQKLKQVRFPIIRSLQAKN
jgi:hypothetical protein